MSNQVFQSVPTNKYPINNFNLGREILLSGKIGRLIPVQCEEVVPGDRFKQSAAFLCRFAPLSAPAMARFNVHFHTFYVPFRIITPENSRESTYEKFIKSIGKHEEDVPVLPFLYSKTAGSSVASRFEVGSLADYLGFPQTDSLPVDDRVSLLPFLAYQRIYQDFYRRDQIEREKVFPTHLVSLELSNMQWQADDISDDLDDLQDAAEPYDLFTLHRRNYERDYFTSALPEPQFGDEVAIGDGNIGWLTMPEILDVGVDFQGQGRVITMPQPGISFGENNYKDARWLEIINNQSPYNGQNQLGDGIVGTNGFTNNLNVFLQGTTPFTNEMGEAIARNLQGNSITINEFRLAMQLQGIKEKINRVGTRYLEIMQGIYGVRVPDARLQRPIYLGGFKNPVTIGSVMQTSESDKTPQGTLTGQMNASGSDVLCHGGYEFKEHGYLMTIMSITPRTSYYGGMPRKFLKRMPEDFYLPQFDHLGEQEVYKGELLYKGNSFTKDTFGYQIRYAELKSSFSTVHGEFRTTLDNWHVSRDFDAQPSLSPDFIKVDSQDVDRIFAFNDIPGTSNEHFYMQIYIDLVAKRRMSKYSTPYTLY